jgi:hypothetical protein
MAEPAAEGRGVPLRWVCPEGLVSRYATNMLVQHTDQEFLLSFYEAVPPVVLGSQEAREESLKSIESIDATCVARIIISAKRMPVFAEAIRSTLEHYNSIMLAQKEE